MTVSQEYVTSLDFFGLLDWLDGTPLLDQIEPYRQRIFTGALDTFEPDGRRRYNLVLAGRGKKNAKTLDLELAALHVLFSEPGPRGQQCFMFASDEGQAADGLSLAKKIIAANPLLEERLIVRKETIERADGKGFLQILPAQDVAGAHGKSFSFCGYDEVHTMRSWALLEAMQLDPNRADALMWLTSYASIHHVPGAPLHDLMKAGKTGTDPKMLFSWYGADFVTDPDYAALDPESRANPSRASWTDQNYLAQQQARLPGHVYRRLHLNLPGLPEGSAYTAEKVMDAIARGCVERAPVPGITYVAFTDHSHGSADDATLAIAHAEGERLVLDLVMKQPRPAPFSMFDVIPRFAAKAREYNVREVVGDAVGGPTYRDTWHKADMGYSVSTRTTSENYEDLEPLLNHGRCDLVDVPLLEQQLLGLIWKGAKITHPNGEHDDLATSTAGALVLLATPGVRMWGGPPRAKTEEEEAEAERERKEASAEMVRAAITKHGVYWPAR
jgi:hypothetical protein